MLFRIWRGESNLWLTLLAFSITLPFLVLAFSAPALLSGDIMQEHPMRRIGGGLIFLAIVVLAGVFQLVAVWRATAPERSGWLARWLSRGVALAVSAGLGVVALLLLPGMIILVQVANDQDWIGRQGYTVSAQGNSLMVQGHLSWALVDKARETLARHGNIDTVILDSPGGHVGVGVKLAEMISARRLNTLVTDTCASACTLAFVAGSERVVQRGARLGFHGVGGDGANAIQSGIARYRSHFRRHGVNEDFIKRALAIPPSEMWFPTLEELRREGVVRP